MILRFMGVNFSAITEGSARIPSAVGANVKPVFIEGIKPTATPVPVAKTPQQDKAMWEGVSLPRNISVSLIYAP
jgi:carboxypeptidase D